VKVADMDGEKKYAQLSVKRYRQERRLNGGVIGVRHRNVALDRSYGDG
jgi:hypothetical protein